MAIYEYRCPECGRFEIARQMGSAPPTCACAQCGGAAQRAYSAPLVNRTPRPLAEALTRAEKSRDEPEVVTTIPGPPPERRPQADPRLKLLPRW